MAIDGGETTDGDGVEWGERTHTALINNVVRDNNVVALLVVARRWWGL